MPAQVFISYTGKDAKSKKLSKKLFDQLKKAGFSPWLDKKRLKPGTQWYPTLTANLVHSQAAVVILSKKALKSSWVKREATYLKTVSDAVPDFKVLTILLDGLTPNDLKEQPFPFDVLHFEDDQLIEVPKTLLQADVPKTIIHSLELIKHMWSAEDGEAKLIKKIKTLLSCQHKNVLIEFASSLKLKQHQWYCHGNKDTLCHGLAHELAGSGIEEIARALCKEIVFFKEDAKLLMKHLYPFKINRKGARRLRHITKSQSSITGLNANTQKIATFYLNRASGSLSEWAWVTTNGIVDPEDIGNQLVNEVSDALKQKFPNYELKTIEKHLAKRYDPFFVIISSPPNEEAIRTLRRTFKTLYFLFVWKELRLITRFVRIIICILLLLLLKNWRKNVF